MLHVWKVKKNSENWCKGMDSSIRFFQLNPWNLKWKVVKKQLAVATIIFLQASWSVEQTLFLVVASPISSEPECDERILQSQWAFVCWFYEEFSSLILLRIYQLVRAKNNDKDSNLPRCGSSSFSHQSVYVFFSSVYTYRVHVIWRTHNGL